MHVLHLAMSWPLQASSCISSLEVAQQEHTKEQGSPGTCEQVLVDSHTPHGALNLQIYGDSNTTTYVLSSCWDIAIQGLGPKLWHGTCFDQ